MRTELLEILVSKPEMVISFPEWMLPSGTIEEFGNIQGTAIVEIAGRDSIAAVLEATRHEDLKAILPTIAYTGTEYGIWDTPLRAIEILRATPSMKNIRIFDPVFLGSPKIWWQLCGRYSYDLVKDFGFYTPCIGCHLYFHSIRIPLAKKLKCKRIIAGERESHDGRIKINQIGVVLDLYKEFLKKFGIALLLPIRYIRSGKDIVNILEKNWDEGTGQLKCVMSKNYVSKDGNVTYSKKDITRFFKDFAIPLADRMIRQQLQYMEDSTGLKYTECTARE